MDLLLDTHVFLWWQASSPRLAPHARQAIADGENGVFMSAASVWEIAIKRRLGKLSFEGSATLALRDCGFEALDVTPEDAEFAGGLAWTHADPFDRMLVAQCRRKGLTLVTADAAIKAYGEVPVLAAR